MPDFADPTKLGSGNEMVQRLTNLIAIFENPAGATESGERNTFPNKSGWKKTSTSNAASA